MGATVKNVLLDVVGSTDQATRELRKVADGIRQIPADTSFTLRGKGVADAAAELDAIHNRLRAIDRERVSPEVSAKVTKAIIEVEAFQAALAAIPDHKSVTMDVRRGALAELVRIEQGVTGIFAGIQKAATAGEQTVGDAVGNIGGTLRSVSPILQGTLILLVVGLIPALLALGSSAVAAVAGIGALGAAFAGALGPAVVVAVAVFSRLTKVIGALKAQTAANQAEQQKNVEQSKALAQAAEQRRNAEQAVKDAIRGVAGAERAVAQARTTAAAQITQAAQRQQDAARSVADANQRLRTVTVDAYRAMADAAQTLRDRMLGLENAKLGLEGARLEAEGARQALSDLRKEAGLADKGFDSLFKRFTNVDVKLDPTVFRKALEQAGAQGVTANKQLELEKALHRVREAQLGIKEANNGVTKSETDLARAQAENQKFRQQGIKAFGPYRDAVQAVADANRRLNLASVEYGRLQAAGINRTPGVVNALEALRSAQVRLTRARQEANRISSDSTLSAQQAKAKSLTDGLTASERKLLVAIQSIRKEMTGLFAPAVDAVFGAMSRALTRMPALLGPLRSGFTAIGKAWAFVIDAFSKELIKPAAVAGVRALVAGSAALTRILGGGVFLNFAKIMGNLAVAAMPALVSLMREFSASLGRTAKGTSNIAKLRESMVPLVDAVRAWFGLIGQVLGAFLDLGRVAGPLGSDMVRWLTDVVRKFRDWVKSAGGQKTIQRFFKQTAPLVKELATFVARLAVAFLVLLQTVEPILRPILATLNLLVRALAAMFNVFNRLPGPVRTVVGLMVALRVAIAAVAFVSRMKAMGKALSEFAGIPAKASTSFLGPFKKMWTSAASVLAGSVTGMKMQLATLADVLRTRLSTALTTARAGLQAGMTAVWGQITTLVAGIRARMSMETMRGIGARAMLALRGAIVAAQAALAAVGRFAVAAIAAGMRAAMFLVARAGAIIGVVLDAAIVAAPFIAIGAAMIAAFVAGFMIGTQLRKAALWLIHGMQDLLDRGVQLIVHIVPQLAKGFIKLANMIPGSGALRDIAGFVGRETAGLAKGGLVTGPTRALVGEAGREAVLPLSKRVMRQLASAITAQMRFAAPMAMAGGAAAVVAPMAGRGGMVIEHQEVHLPPAPEGGIADARYQAVQFSREIQRRGGKA